MDTIKNILHPCYHDNAQAKHVDMNSAHLYSFQTIQAQNIYFVVYANSFHKVNLQFRFFQFSTQA